MTAHDKLERHEKTAELLHISPQGKRIALIIAVLAAFLAVTEVYAENRISYVIKDETKIAHLNATLELDAIADLLGKPHDDHADVRAEVAALEAHQASATTAHKRLEYAVILLELGIVLSSISVLLGVRNLLRGGVFLGTAGVGVMVAGFLA
jgi:hypothetical protein